MAWLKAPIGFPGQFTFPGVADSLGTTPGTAILSQLGVHPDCRGQGVGEKLVREAESEAVDAGRIIMRLEVREDNRGAINLYKRLGYRQFGTYRDYYEDHGDALRFERRILFYEPSREFPAVPYYPQTTDFSCGPAALIRAR